PSATATPSLHDALPICPRQRLLRLFDQMEMLIHGERVGAASGARTEVRDPATGEVVDTVPKADAADTRRGINAAAAAFTMWSKTDRKSTRLNSSHRTIS